MSSPEWMGLAVCQDHDPELWFPHPSDRAAIAEAQQICRSCPVQTLCRQHADRIGARHGIWAAQTRQLTDLPEPRTPEIRHGTRAGARQHYRLGELPVCQPCREASNHYERERQEHLRRKVAL